MLGYCAAFTTLSYVCYSRVSGFEDAALAYSNGLSLSAVFT
jgi:hypothetical protein